MFEGGWGVIRTDASFLGKVVKGDISVAYAGR